ncbi:MAG TPA: TRAP transporter small permease [Thermohalobaculum sp.]|nr:TRAP transporter small permease [Thermohalobaculum sp.]
MAVADDALGRVVVAGERLLRPVENTLNFIAAVAVLFLMMLGVVQVVMRIRWLFAAPIYGYIDMIELAMPILAVLGISYAQRHGTHIRMEILILQLKGRVLWVIETFGSLVTLILIVLLTRFAWVFFHDAYLSGDSTTDALLLTWPSKLLVPMALAILSVRLLIQTIAGLRLVIDPTREPIGVVVPHDVAEQAREEIREALGEEGPQ